MTLSPPRASSLSGRGSNASSHVSVPLENAADTLTVGTAVLTRSRWLRVMATILTAAFVLTILCLQVGTRYVSIGEIMRTLGRAVGLFMLDGGESQMTTDTIVLHLRMPRVFLGFMVGIALASVGVVLQ